MNKLYMMIVIASVLGSSMVYAACGVPSGSAGCTTGDSDYPTCTSPVPTSNSCTGNPTYECRASTPSCSNPELVANYLKKSCDAKKDVNKNPIYDTYTQYSGSSVPCGQ